ncbi:MAG TPA: hypothetical protein VHV81_13145 [Steroidobacteraceae bacterium]|jgi:hypothetical protein|nr:hypothetical protein [Steroidobacteraceae bacterium]
MSHAFVAGLRYRCRVIFLLAILRFALPPEPSANDLLAYAQMRLGHIALTVIALVYVLVTFWR